METAFQTFGHDHLVALALIAAASTAAVTFVRHAGSGAQRTVRLVLAAALAAGIPVEQVVAVYQGWSGPNLLPLHMCDVAVLLAIVSLLTLDLRTVEPLYFFALSGTLPALITPELTPGFPSFRFLIYFIPHGLVVLSGLVLVVGLRRVPRPGAWWRTLLGLNIYAAFVGLVNWALATNFLYLAHKPRMHTPFDWFGPWPWYILTLEVLCGVVFRLLELLVSPWRTAGDTPA